MRVVFMGTPQFAVPSLDALYRAGHEVALVVTQPDRPSGRGRKLAPPPVKVRASELGLEVYQPERVKNPEAVERLKDARPDVIAVAAFGQILPKSILDIPPRGCLNVHASILPGYRGAAPVNWAIIRGEPVTGVTIMRMDPGMDTGDMLLVGEEPVRPDDTAGTLTERLSRLGAGMLVDALTRLDELEAVKQDEAKATYAPILKKDMGRVDWGLAAAELERLVRGLDPWPGAFTVRGGENLRIWGAKVDESGIFSGAPGEVVDVNRNGVKVMTGKDVLVITELQVRGGRRMTASDYLAGHSIEKGERLG